jgi:predicted Ser/Thr protein kinase
MTKREAIKHLKRLNIFSRFTLDRLSRGNNSDAFEIRAGGKRFTLRSQRNDSRHENWLENHYINLKFLEASKINFVPRAVHYDKQDKLLVATYVPGRDIVIRGFKGNELNTFARYKSSGNPVSQY